MKKKPLKKLQKKKPSAKKIKPLKKVSKKSLPKTKSVKSSKKPSKGGLSNAKVFNKKHSTSLHSHKTSSVKGRDRHLQSKGADAQDTPKSVRTATSLDKSVPSLDKPRFIKRRYKSSKSSAEKTEVFAEYKEFPPENHPRKTKKEITRKAVLQANYPKKAVIEREYFIVAIHPRSKKIIQSPKPGSPINYAIRYPSGEVKEIQSHFIQHYSKTDLAGIQKVLDRSGHKHFVLHEQLIKSRYADPKTGVVRQAEKLTYGRVNSTQRPVLYSEGKRVRTLDLGFRNRSARQLVDDTLLKVLTPNNKWVRNITMAGDTIKQTLKNIVVRISMEQIKRYELRGFYWEVVLKVRGEDPIVMYGKTTSGRKSMQAKIIGKTEVYANFVTDVARA